MKFFAAIPWIMRPTSVLPVNTILRTGGTKSVSPTVLPEATTVFSTPAGNPPPTLNISLIFMPIRAVSDAGLNTTVLPASKEKTIPEIGIEKG